MPQAKFEIFDKADQKLEQIKTFYNKGKLTEAKDIKIVIKLWTGVKDEVQEVVRQEFEADDRNPIFIMSDSGARGSLSNFTPVSRYAWIDVKSKKGKQSSYQSSLPSVKV